MQKLPLIFALFCLALCGQYVSAQPTGMSYGVKDAAPDSPNADPFRQTAAFVTGGSTIIKDAAPGYATAEGSDQMHGSTGWRHLAATAASFAHRADAAACDFIFGKGNRPDALDVCIVAAAVAAFAWSRRRKYEKDFVDVMVFETDPSGTDTAAFPTQNSLWRLFTFTKNVNQRAIFRINGGTEYRISSAMECSIDRGSVALPDKGAQSPESRARQIEQFHANIRAVTAAHNKVLAALPARESPCIAKIAEDLNIFSNGCARTQIMVIRGGIREYSSLFRCTSEADLLLLYQSPDQLVSRFRDALSIGKLPNVTVYFMYEPVDCADRRYYEAMVYVLSSLFSSLGAKVITFTSKDGL